MLQSTDYVSEYRKPTFTDPGMPFTSRLCAINASAHTHTHTHRKRTPVIAKRPTLRLFHSESGFPIGRSVKHAMTARMLRSACVIRWNHLIGCSLPVRPCALFTVKNSKWHLGEATSTWAVNWANNDNEYLRIYLVLCRCNLAFFYFCNCAVSEADPIGECWRL